jgi:hypothetical protein
VLDKPFKDVCQHLSLGEKVTPKAMRRTFQDLPGVAAVDGLVQRSICGHLTEEMTECYRPPGKLGGGRNKVVGKTGSTPTTLTASPSQVPVIA